VIAPFRIVTLRSDSQPAPLRRAVGRDAEQHGETDVPDGECGGREDNEAVDLLAAGLAASQGELNARQKQNNRDLPRIRLWGAAGRMRR